MDRVGRRRRRNESALTYPSGMRWGIDQKLAVEDLKQSIVPPEFVVTSRRESSKKLLADASSYGLE
jgi:hypothetical protein